MAETTPLINGKKHQFASVSLKFDGVEFNEFTKIDYKHNVDRSRVMGNSRETLGFTKGEYKAEGSFSLILREYNNLIAFLGPGYMDVVFDISVSFDDDDGQGMITDEIIGCMFKEPGKSFSKGTDALEVEVSLDVTKIKENGLDPLPQPTTTG